MRSKLSLLLALAGMLVGTCCPGSAASAQGFFEKLFGIGAAAPAEPAAATAPPPAARVEPPAWSPAPAPSSASAPAAPIQSEAKSPPSASAQYRTLCVRTCDGYYFPISAAVTRGRIAQDAGRCRAKCGSDTQLFYLPASSGDVGGMVDLQGRAYGSLPNAFRYRKSLVEGCKCKPDPWAQSEIDRHRYYALEAAKRAGDEPSETEPSPPSASVAEARGSPQPSPDDGGSGPITVVDDGPSDDGARPATEPYAGTILALTRSRRAPVRATGGEDRTRPPPRPAVLRGQPLYGDGFSGLGGPPRLRFLGDDR